MFTNRGNASRCHCIHPSIHPGRLYGSSSGCTQAFTLRVPPSLHAHACTPRTHHTHTHADENHCMWHSQARLCRGAHGAPSVTHTANRSVQLPPTGTHTHAPNAQHAAERVRGARPRWPRDSTCRHAARPQPPTPQRARHASGRACGATGSTAPGCHRGTQPPQQRCCYPRLCILTPSSAAAPHHNVRTRYVL